MRLNTVGKAARAVKGLGGKDVRERVMTVMSYEEG